MGQGALLIGTLLPKAHNFPIAPVGWKRTTPRGRKEGEEEWPLAEIF